MADQSFVAGGELGEAGEGTAAKLAALKGTIVQILQDGENVKQALVRLKPKVTGRKRKAPARGKAAAKAEDADGADAESSRLFDTLTEAANELMTSGFEDIYEDPKEAIQTSLSMPMEGVSTGQNVWHDDGTADGQGQDHPMYKRDTADDVAAFKDLPAAQPAQAEQSVEPAAAEAGAAMLADNQPLSKEAVEVAETAAETMEAAVAADANAAAAAVDAAVEVAETALETAVEAAAAGDANAAAAAVEVAETAVGTAVEAKAVKAEAVEAAAKTAVEELEYVPVTAEAAPDTVLSSEAPAVTVTDAPANPQPAIAGGDGAAAPAAASEGAREVQSAPASAASAPVSTQGALTDVPTSQAPVAAETEGQTDVGENGSAEDIPGVGASEVPAAEVASGQEAAAVTGGSTQAGSKPGGPADASRLAPKGNKYKTELCKYYVNNRCTRGNTCLYAHSTEEMPQHARAGAHQRAQQHSRGGPGGGRGGGFGSPTFSGGRGGRGRTTWQHSYNHQQGPHGGRGFGGGPSFGGPAHFGGPAQPRPYLPHTPAQPYAQMAPQAYAAPQYGGYPQAPAPGGYPHQAAPAAIPQQQYAQAQPAQAYAGYADPYAGYAQQAATPAAAQQVGYGTQQAYAQQAATPQAYAYAPQAVVQPQAQAARPYAPQGAAAPYAGPGPY